MIYVIILIAFVLIVVIPFTVILTGSPIQRLNSSLKDFNKKQRARDKVMLKRIFSRRKR